MRLPWSRASRTDRPEIDIWRLKALFTNFRRILDLNNKVLTLMADMEQALGGEYIFDQAFLVSSVRRIATHVHHVVYSLNALTGNSYVPLYDRFEDVFGILDAILSGSMDALDIPLVLPLRDAGWELEPVAGMEAMCLAELSRHAGIRVTDGFILTDPAVRLLGRCSHDDLGTQRRQMEHLLADVLGKLPSGIRSLTVIGLPAGHDLDPVAQTDLFSFTFELPQTGPEENPWPQTARDLADDILLYVQLVDCSRLVSVLGLADPQGSLHGLVRTRAKGSYGRLRVRAWPAGRRDDDPDAYLLRRVHPFDLVSSEIPAREPGTRFPDGNRATDYGDKGMRRGSFLVAPDLLHDLAETGMALERLLGAAAEIRWQAGETPVICRAHPAAVQPGQSSETDLAECLSRAFVLARGGQTVQSGAAAGRAVHVAEDMEPSRFPLGAVAVARTASPRLSPILHRASAIITEQGTAAGHLATVARELRLPAVFGLADARKSIPHGVEVTVDAAEATVYAGAIEELLEHAADGALIPTDPEYRTLRRLLRFLMPLNLTNPDAANFTMQGCRTMHDIIHFCHDRAVDELAHIQDRRPELGEIRTRRLRLDLPLAIRVLDIDNALAPDAGDNPGPEDIRCAPFLHFLRGLARPEAWSFQAAELGVGDFMASLSQTSGMLQPGADGFRESLALIGRDYLNLSLRTGYHFSVVDAFLGADPGRNYVYFRFGGGVARGRGRERRARFIGQVLECMDFHTARTGDLITGRLKLAEPEELRAALETLGALTAFSRQQDTALKSDADVDAMARTFITTFATCTRCQEDPA